MNHFCCSFRYDASKEIEKLQKVWDEQRDEWKKKKEKNMKHKAEREGPGFMDIFSNIFNKKSWF